MAAVLNPLPTLFSSEQGHAHAPAPAADAPREVLLSDVARNPAIVGSWHYPDKMYNAKEGTTMAFVSVSDKTKAKPVISFPTCRVPYDVKLATEIKDPATGIITNKTPSNTTKFSISISLDDAETVANANALANAIRSVYEAKKRTWYGQYDDTERIFKSFVSKSKERNEDGSPKYAPTVNFDVVWEPSKNAGLPFRFAGTYDPSTRAFDGRSAAQVGEYVLTPDPVSWKETTIFRRQEDGMLVDKVAVKDEADRPITCSRTGRILYRFLGPRDIRKNFEAAVDGKFDTIWINGLNVIGVKFVAGRVVFVPKETEDAAQTTGGFLAPELSGSTVMPVQWTPAPPAHAQPVLSHQPVLSRQPAHAATLRSMGAASLVDGGFPFVPEESGEDSRMDGSD
jgi:hypothetical protein